VSPYATTSTDHAEPIPPVWKIVGCIIMVPVVFSLLVVSFAFLCEWFELERVRGWVFAKRMGILALILFVYTQPFTLVMFWFSSKADEMTKKRKALLNGTYYTIYFGEKR
jgi:hypothetical protein